MYNVNNNAQFIGTLQADPEIIQEQDNGGAIATVILACQDNFLGRDGSPSVQYIRLVKPIPKDDNKALESVMDLHKGDQVIVTASLSVQSWTGSEGTIHGDVKIIADEFIPTSSIRTNPGQAAQAPQD